MSFINWNLKNFEKSKEEAHLNTFRSLEIENYLITVLKKKNFGSFNLKLNFSNKTLTIFLSIYRKKENETNKTRQLNKNIREQNKKLKKIFLKSILRSLNQFINNKFHVVLKIKVLEKRQLRKDFLNLNFYKFKIPEMRQLYTILATQTNTPKLLGIFLANHLEATKRHNFFLNSFSTSLALLLSQKDSKIKGIKILINGRLNNAPRSRNKIVKIGKIPLLTHNIKIKYSETTAYTSNGTIGIKIWMNENNKFKCFYNQKKLNIKKLGKENYIN